MSEELLSAPAVQLRFSKLIRDMNRSISRVVKNLVGFLIHQILSDVLREEQ